MRRGLPRPNPCACCLLPHTPPFTQKLQSLLYFTHHQRVAEALRAAGATRVELIPALDIDILNRYAEQNR